MDIITVVADIVIIGGGPAGFTAAIYTGRAGYNTILVDDGMSQLAGTTEVENFPGWKGDGPELIDKMREQARLYAQLIHGRVDRVHETTGTHPMAVNTKTHHVRARLIIIATGAKAKWLGLECEQHYINKGISACATCDGPLPIFRNGKIAVVGGGDSAMEEALFLAKFAQHVTVYVRGDRLRASQHMQNKVRDNPKISIEFNTNIVGYEGENRLEYIAVEHNGPLDGVICTQPCNGVFMAIGHTPNTEFLDTIVEKDDHNYVKVHNNTHTSHPRIFACGDCHDAQYRQAITAAGFGCMAAIDAGKYLSN